MIDYTNNKGISLHKLSNKQINIFLKVIIAILKKLQNYKREYNKELEIWKRKEIESL
jgi:hypothetical protein